jgi:hypothetical protein
VGFLGMFGFDSVGLWALVLLEKKKNRFPDWKSFSSDFILNLVSIF